MNYAANIAAVDAHAEGDGRDDYIDLFGSKAVLRAAPVLSLHSGMIIGSTDAGRHQVASHSLSLFASDAIDDRRLIRMPPQHLGHLRIDILLRYYPIYEIRPIEGADEHGRIFEPELLGNVSANARRGGCGIGVDARLLETALQLG